MTSNLPQKTGDSSAIVSDYQKFLAEYDEASELCTKVQLFRKAAGIPAINEMRYAGYHLRFAFDDQARLVDQDQLRKARGHAQRASYEAAEAGLLLALEEINLFKEDYKNVIVTGDVKDYVAILADCDEAQGRLGVQRNLGDGQVLDHARHRQLFETFSKAANTLHAARPEINKRMNESRTGKRRWLVTTLIALCALVAAFFKERFWSLLMP